MSGRPHDLAPLARFGGLVATDVRDVPALEPGTWRGPAPDYWTSSLDRAAYIAGVRPRGVVA